jgi:branched-chain amino acid transport system permease protein
MEHSTHFHHPAISPIVDDGLTIGLSMLRSPRYTMDMVLNHQLAHSEIFATGAFVGVEILIALDTTGILARASLGLAYGFLIFAILAGMVAAGFLAVIVERVAYRPLRGAPRLVPLISAIGVSFLLQDVIRLVEGLTTGQFNRIFPTFGNFDERLIFGQALEHRPLMGIDQPHRRHILMLVGLNYGERHQGGNHSRGHRIRNCRLMGTM